MAIESYDFFDFEPVGNVACLRVAVKEIRHPQSAQQFGAEVRAAAQSLGLTRVLIDLGETEYLGSTAFATLLNLAKTMSEAGGVLKLCNLHPDVQVGAKILGLGHAVEIHPDRKSGLKSFAQAS
jgi:anti-anti-sigma factor